MISLQPPEGEFDIEVMPGIVFKVRPLDSFSMYLAQARARDIMERLEHSVADVIDIGVVVKRDIDLSDEKAKDALYKEILIGELAENHIVAWRGVEGDIRAENAKRMVARLFPIGDIFYQKLTRWHTDLLSAKKDCGAEASGISAAAPNSAKDAETLEAPAPMGSPD